MEGPRLHLAHNRLSSEATVLIPHVEGSRGREMAPQIGSVLENISSVLHILHISGTFKILKSLVQLSCHGEGPQDS